MRRPAYLRKDFRRYGFCKQGGLGNIDRGECCRNSLPHRSRDLPIPPSLLLE